MSDNYKAVYDAVRSKMSFIDSSQIFNSLDFSFYAEQIRNSFQEVAWEMARPCNILKPKIYLDGDMWCALYGTDLQEGVAGFGKSPQKAMEDLDKNWCLDIDR